MLEILLIALYFPLKMQAALAMPLGLSKAVTSALDACGENTKTSCEMRYVRIQKALECMHGVSERHGRSEPLTSCITDRKQWLVVPSCLMTTSLTTGSCDILCIPKLPQLSLCQGNSLNDQPIFFSRL